MNLTLKRYQLVFLFILALVAAPRGFAQAQCPWLNAATAGGLLGGEVQTVVSAPNTFGDVNCDFTRNPGPTASSLKIDVHTMTNPSKDFAAYLAQCGGTTQPLKAIGNEAVQCFSGSNLKGEERIIGRVRDRAFIISLRASPPYRTSSSKAELSDEARNLAEQVAGALF